MPKAHRDGDDRSCGAKTVVVGQSTVFVNGKLWAVLDDPNDHGNGQLINSSGSTVFIEGKPVIVHGADHAKPDNAGHPDPMTAEGSGDVFAYGS
jgi:uncharacterized Zn-binding protein involved in type VI secretion